jgi:ParB family chromosome partitioning protein
MLRLDEIRPNPFQPRESFPKEDIQTLANTIKEVGLLQPISVRKKGKTYQIISGERRWRACQFAGLKEIPAILRDVSDSQLMMESLIENVHRKDLEPIERARGLAEVYRLAGFEPANAMSVLTTLDRFSRKRLERRLKKEEVRVKELADVVAFLTIINIGF